jgi:phosphatidate cytidylyltransferase
MNCGRAASARYPTIQKPEVLSWRLWSAAVGLPVVLLLVLVGGPLFDAALAAILFAATVEFQLQARPDWNSIALWLSAVAAAALAFFAPAGRLAAFGLLAAALVIAVLIYAACVDGTRLSRIRLAIIVALYVGWLGQYLHLIRSLPLGRSWTLLLLLVTFASDTAAYAVGRSLGKHRLAPRISPGKTVEGALAGLLGAAVAGGLLAALLHLPLPLAVALAAGAVLSVAAQAGDLAESALKRSLKLKDAGMLVPGHGGLLDRLDSLLFAGAVLYYVARWVSL